MHQQKVTKLQKHRDGSSTRWQQGWDEINKTLQEAQHGK